MTDFKKSKILNTEGLDCLNKKKKKQPKPMVLQLKAFYNLMSDYILICLHPPLFYGLSYLQYCPHLVK